jgi:hypothetical protein
MTPRALAQILKEFGISRPTSDGPLRGYLRDDFQDAFIRYNALEEDEQTVKPPIKIEPIDIDPVLT